MLITQMKEVGDTTSSTRIWDSMDSAEVRDLSLINVQKVEYLFKSYSIL